MVADGVCVKGVVLQSRLQHIRSSYGEVTLNNVVARLLESDRELLRGALLVPTLWYPVAVAIRLDQAITAHFPSTAQRFTFRHIGRVLANLVCDNPRQLLRRGDPHYVMRSSSQLYAQLYRYSERTCEQIDANTCAVRSTGPESIAVTDCLVAVGWFERVLELSGALDAEVDERICRLQGAKACEHLCHWKVAGVALTGLAAAPY